MRRREHGRQAFERAATGAGRDHAGQIAHLLAADRVMMDQVQRIAGLRHVDPRQRPPGAADQIEIALCPAAESQGDRPRDPPRRSRAPATVITASPIGEADDAERQGAAPRAATPASSHTTSTDPPPRSARMPSALGMPHSMPRAESSASCSPDSTRIGMAGKLSGPQCRHERRVRCWHRARRPSPAPRSGRRAWRARSRDSGSSRTIACSTPSGLSRPVVLQAASQPQHRLFVEHGDRVALPSPSNTTRRTEFEPRSTSAQRGGSIRTLESRGRWLLVGPAQRREQPWHALPPFLPPGSILQHPVLPPRSTPVRCNQRPVQRRAAARQRRVGHEVVVRRDRLRPGCRPDASRRRDAAPTTGASPSGSPP